MAIPVWPDINFYAEQGSWSLALSDGKDKTTTELDSGQSRTRLRFSNSLSPISFDVVLDKDEVEVFKYFYKVVLRKGTLWFNMPTLDGDRYRVNLVKFADNTGPSIKPIGYRTYAVSLNLLAYELTQMEAELYDYFLRVGLRASRRIGSVVADFVNNVYPEITGN